MFQLFYRNQAIPAGRNLGATIKWANPCCYFDKMPGDTGIGLEIPVNEYTRYIFGHPERFEKYRSGESFTRTFPGCDLRFSGTLLLSGTLKITNASPASYSGWLQSTLGEMGEAQRNKFIDELEWKQEQEFVNKQIYVDGSDDYCCAELKNSGFWEGKGRAVANTVPYEDQNGETKEFQEEISVLSSQFRQNFEYLVNRADVMGEVDTEGIATNAASRGCVVSPFLFLSYLGKEMLRANKWFIDTATSDTITSLQGLFVYNNFNIFGQEYNTEPVTPPPAFNFDTADWDNPGDVLQITGVTWRITSFGYADLVPRVSLRDLIMGLQNMLNIVFCFRKNNKVSVKDRNEVLSQDPYDLDAFFAGDWAVAEKKELELKFITHYDQNDAITSDNYHDLSDRRDSFSDAVDTKADLLAITGDDFGSIRYVKDEDKYYEWKWTVATSVDPDYSESSVDALAWEFVSTGPQPFYYGEGNETEEIETKISTLQMGTMRKTSILLDKEEVTVPMAIQRGNVGTMRSAWSDFSPRLLFYHGGGKASASNIYSDPTSLAYDPDLALTLNWDGENGLFEKRWRKWATFWAARLPVTGSFKLPMNILNYVSDNITGVFSTRHGRFIIEEMETEFQGNLVGTTTIRAFKI